MALPSILLNAIRIWNRLRYLYSNLIAWVSPRDDPGHKMSGFTSRGLARRLRAEPRVPSRTFLLCRRRHLHCCRRQPIFNPGLDERICAGDVLVALGPVNVLDGIEKATK